MPKALIAYATRTNQTPGIAKEISEGMRVSGIDATVVNINEIEKKGIDIANYDAVVLGAPTYHGEMIQSMKTFLFSLEKYDLSGKAGGAFGAFGWSGEAPGRIFETMRNVFKMEMVSGPLRLKSISTEGGPKMAQDYGAEVAKKVVG